MAQEATTPAPAPGGAAEAPQVEEGNYEVIRTRLIEQGRELAKRAEALNKRRKDVFGGTELSVVATERIRTENNCVPVDIVQVGGFLLLGYNVFIGLKSETQLADVFALHNFKPPANGEGFDCSAAGLGAAGGFLQQPEFLKDFATLYKFTRDARLIALQTTETRLLAVFQIGSSYRDIRAFHWRIESNGKVTYVDDRGERLYTFPPSHAFEWSVPEPEQYVGGQYINLHDKVFVSCTGGRLRLGVEDNTAAGRYVFNEPVEDSNQVVNDAGVRYAEVGPLVLIEVLPFRETTKRYLVFNTKTDSAVRLDAIGLSCQELPEDHGIVFPGGYYLESGDYKVFEIETDELEFERRISSPNGEDVLYVFFRRRDGHYVLSPYNLIRKEVQTPIHCHGYCLFESGIMVVFRATSDEPTRVHPMQVWDTPFTSAEYAAVASTDGSYLSKVGNAELVRGISDAFTLCRLINNASPTRQVFDDLVRNTVRVLDAYYWLAHKETGDLRSVIEQVRVTSELIIDEFEKVLAFRAQAVQALKETEERYERLVRELRTEHYKKVDPFLEALTALRGLRGHIITMREMRYMDLGALDVLEQQTKARFDEVSKDCVAFLLKQEALEPLKKDLEATLGQLDQVAKVSDVEPLRKKVDTTSEGLDLLSEVVANLKIDDATQRTRILQGIGEVFAQLNRTRATIMGRRKELLGVEGRAEFSAQFQLLGQSVASAIALCDTPEKCDEQLSRLLVQLEELEGRFSELDEFLGDLSSKREEIYEALGAKKQQLLDERQRRVMNLAGAADRILEGVARRARSFAGADELNGYFASDAMVMKVRQLCEQLVELGDSVKADGYLGKLKGARQDALRGLRDKLELFEEGDDLIKLGRHRFSVNTQRLELAMVPRDGRMCLHMSGTDFYEVIEDATFAETQRFWEQTLVSENTDVYRGEYLAHCILGDAERGAAGLSVGKLHEELRDGKLVERARIYAESRYDEGYDRGIHDHDAALILEKLINVREAAGLLRYAPAPRALACLFWGWLRDDEDKQRWHLQARSLGRLRGSLGHSERLARLARELTHAMTTFVADSGIDGFDERSAVVAGEYLVEELMADQPRFSTSAEAVQLRDALLRHLDLHGDRRAFDDDMRALENRLRERLSLARAWVEVFLDADATRRARRYLADEAAAMLCDRQIDRQTSSALTEVVVAGLLGQHPRIKDGKLTVRIEELLSRVGAFAANDVPAYRAYRELRHQILEREKKRLRLEELMPKVMTAFVRNKLINDVYLPLIGDNLAKQIGAAGEGKRTDLMGLLLLTSPPGYGKTTLMEYIANRLGLVFVKVNGPALGHGVRSLDPSEAPNATARQEVEKISLAFEMGTNVMLYLDDIQHTHEELLQKFISLCDAQRRVEGVYKGQTRTYDMRGKKFCVVMAGNPYTESGEKFKIPDMLANRADTYNLGDILEGKEEAFALSYIENALTSNPALAPLATREQSDVYTIVRMARGEEIPTTDLSHGYAAVELSEIKQIFVHLFRVQETLLAVNQMYIESASQDDRFRTEPPFKLQGSYRNMNRLAEKIVAAMNDGEIHKLVTEHYIGESQTLTTGAEANLLKLGELRGKQDETEAARWKDIKAEYLRHKRMGGSADDPVSRVTGTLSGLSAGLDGIKDALVAGANRGMDDQLAGLGKELGAIRTTLEAGAGGELGAKLDKVGTALVSIRSALEKGSAGDTDKRLEALGSRLEAIRRVIREAAKQMAGAPAGAASGAELAEPRAADMAAAGTLSTTSPGTEEEFVDQVSNPRVWRAQRLAGGEQWMTPYFLRIEAALEALGRPKLEVTTTSPAGLDELLQNQVNIIERTLVPLVKTATLHLHDSRRMTETLDEVLAMLRQIDAQMRGGAAP